VLLWFVFSEAKGSRLVQILALRFLWFICQNIPARSIIVAEGIECRMPTTQRGLFGQRAGSPTPAWWWPDPACQDRTARLKAVISSNFSEFTTLAPVAGCTGPVGSRGLNGSNLALGVHS
jgi:hypothetical protein